MENLQRVYLLQHYTVLFWVQQTLVLKCVSLICLNNLAVQIPSNAIVRGIQVRWKRGANLSPGTSMNSF